MAVKHVVSVGLGSSTRDAYIETELLGQPILIERLGSDGDLDKAAALLRNLDGKVDAFGLGGTDLFIQAAGRRYYIRDSQRLAKNAQKTPLVCGAGLKDTLERMVVRQLDSVIHWKDKKVLMVSAVDRFGMAETLAELGADIIYADLIFILGLALPIRSLKILSLTSRVFAPLITQLPIKWLYPTGSKQEKTETGWRSKYFDWADVIAGDFHFVKRYAPENLRGKIILTNTTTTEDVEMLRKRGVDMLITTTPRYNGRSLSTNMLEAAFVALSGKFPLSDADYRELIEKSGVKPDVLELN
jgi:hypothetical protein